MRTKSLKETQAKYQAKKPEAVLKARKKFQQKQKMIKLNKMRLKLGWSKL